jgi:hypothetical protein
MPCSQNKDYYQRCTSVRLNIPEEFGQQPNGTTYKSCVACRLEGHFWKHIAKAKNGDDKTRVYKWRDVMLRSIPELVFYQRIASKELSPLSWEEISRVCWLQRALSNEYDQPQCCVEEIENFTGKLPTIKVKTKFVYDKLPRCYGFTKPDPSTQPSC